MIELFTNARYPCPDCAREGKPQSQPPEQFYFYRVKKRQGAWRRSAYCMTHMRKRDQAWRASRKPQA